jgi:glycosyltransferase involved in cell wall biosynthesis
VTVVHIITGLGGGGAEQMVFNLVKNAKKHHANHLVLSLTKVKALEYKFKEIDAEYYFLNINSFKTFIKGLSKTKKLLKDKDFVFHCHMFHAVVFGIAYKLFYQKTSVFFTMHTNNVKQFYRKVLLCFTKPFRKKDIIFSKNSTKWYLKNSVVIRNGIDFKKFSFTENRSFKNTETFKFLFLGRLYEPKNPLVLIDFAKYLINQNIINFRIDIVGDGNMRAQLENAITTNNLEKHFKLHYFQKDVKPFLEQSHCLILPSLWEGMPMSIIEAAAMKLPIIATPVGSIPDFLDNSNASISELNTFHLEMSTIFNNYNDSLEKSEKLYLQMGETFDIENVFKKHIDLYASKN